ncbi:MAG: M15 family metallopeptidase, partial [Gemmatimonadaceae bacterium]|nr:M15 family metallopeptidase [Gemmatimonadaceae bacterium]
MSLLPVVPQPPRARSDVAPSAAPERRTSEVTRDRFAASLAHARSDRAAGSEYSPARSDRATLANSAPDSEEYAAAKMRLVAQQRAQLSTLMLNGAMKYAVTRNDATASAVVADVVASQPDMIAIPATDDVTIDATAVLAAAPRDGANSVPWIVMPDVQPPAMPIAIHITAALQVLPGITTITNPEATDESGVSASEDAGIDLTASDAVTAAALQMIAALPIGRTTPAPDAEDSPSASDTTTDSSDAKVVLESVVTSLPERVDAALVEDHFDAPAAALYLTTQTATPTSAASTHAHGATSSTDVRAAASRAASSSADISSLQTDLTKLDPEFRERLQKVIDRMHTEYGHAVRIVETVRSQSRQDALFAQGRTEPGPVVTWTTHSKHGTGLAADLIVDGAWKNPVGYAHLATLARQEGLRTLGARDPGHVELPSDASVSGETLGNLLSDLAGDAGDAARQMRADVNSGAGGESRAALMNRVANVAQVARVATVASVAQVARVATVARPGAGPAAPAAS